MVQTQFEQGLRLCLPLTSVCAVCVLCCCVCTRDQGVDVVAAHGDKDQQERLDAVRDFKTGASVRQIGQ